MSLSTIVSYLMTAAALSIPASHLLERVFLLVRLDRAAAWIGKYGPSISALLAKAPDVAKDVADVAAVVKTQSPAAGLVVGLQHFEELASKSSETADALTLVKGGIKALGVALVAFLLVACSNYDALRSAVDISNGVSQLEGVAVPVLQEKCVRPMQAVAAEADSPERVAKAKALAKTCDPMIGAYDGLRRAHLLALQGIAQAETGGITVGAVFDLVERLTEAAAALEKEIVQ
jgi:hypothetical protein